MVGYIAQRGDGAFSHRFGGASWQVIDAEPINEGPALLLVLDLRDERLWPLALRGLSELPLASYINDCVWHEEQRYRIQPDTRAVQLESRSGAILDSLDAGDRFPQPLPEQHLMLRPIQRAEDPAEVGCIEASETFVGGTSFLRILAPTVWLQDPIEVICSCNATMTYAASIGYEVGAGTVLDRPFFIGEAALYFFVCTQCLLVAVRSQST